MAGIVVEQICRGSVGSIYHRFSALPVRVGRAPDNDVILADPYVSPHHCTIEESDTGWIVTDCSSINGTFIGRGTRISSPVELQSGDYLQVGRCVLRLLSPQHSVPEALPFKPRTSAAATIAIPVAAVCSLIAAFAFVTMDRFFDTVTETQPISLLAEALPLLLFPVLWAGFWALAGFIVKRRSDFGLQLIVANTAFVLLLSAAALLEWLEYWTSNLQMATLLGYAGMGTFAIALLFVNLKVATGILDIRRAVVAFCIGGSILVMIAVSDHARAVDDELAPRYSKTLKPPIVFPVRPMTVDQFFENNKSLFEDDNRRE